MRLEYCYRKGIFHVKILLHAEYVRVVKRGQGEELYPESKRDTEAHPLAGLFDLLFLRLLNVITDWDKNFFVKVVWFLSL